MSTSQSAVTLCGWGSKGRYGSFHLWVNEWVLCDPTLYVGALEVSHYKALY